MITASMHTENAGESLSALRFGARASLVQNMARQNVAENVPGVQPGEMLSDSGNLVTVFSGWTPQSDARVYLCKWSWPL